MLETARALALLSKNDGWIPERVQMRNSYSYKSLIILQDIYFCSWDAEEYALGGSTAWGEANADSLRSRAILYINTDVGKQI